VNNQSGGFLSGGICKTRVPGWVFAKRRRR